MTKNDNLEDGNLPVYDTSGSKFGDKILSIDNSADKHELFRLVIEHLPDQIYLKNRLGKFLLCNTAVAKNAGCTSPQELIGKTDFDFYPTEAAERFLADETRIMQTAEALINHEEHYIDKQTNEVKWNLTTKIPVRDEANVVIGLMGINRDITLMKNVLLQQERMLIDLQHRNRELEEFTHIVSHNLRSPVANILGLLALATDRDPGPAEEVMPILEHIASSAKKLDEIIRELNKILEARQKPPE